MFNSDDDSINDKIIDGRQAHSLNLRKAHKVRLIHNATIVCLTMGNRL